MDNKRIIREDDWFQSKKYYLNYPVMNDRIAFTKGKIGIDIPSKWLTWDAPSRIPMAISSDFLKLFIFEGHKHRSIVDHFPSKDKIYYNFFSSNSCNFLTGSSRGKEDCPKGYVLCKNATEPTV